MQTISNISLIFSTLDNIIPEMILYYFHSNRSTHLSKHYHLQHTHPLWHLHVQYSELYKIVCINFQSKQNCFHYINSYYIHSFHYWTHVYTHISTYHLPNNHNLHSRSQVLETISFSYHTITSFLLHNLPVNLSIA